MCIRVFFILIIFLFSFQKSVGQVLSQDSLALVALYNSTTIKPVFSDSAWLSGRVATWKGVRVTGNRVTSLSFKHQLLTALPSEFCNLTGLVNLDLSENNLPGDFPACFSYFTSLKYLDLDSNRFSGAIPDFVVTNLTQLQTLNVSYNAFTGMPDFSAMSSLKNLNVLRNNLYFDDVLPTMGTPGLNYQFLYQNDYTPPGAGEAMMYSSFTFPDRSISGTGNVYHWWATSQRGIRSLSAPKFQGVESPVLTNTSVLLEDQTTYFCIVTNPAIPDMKLVSGYFMLYVVDNRREQVLSFGNDTMLYCGDVPQTLSVSSNAGPDKPIYIFSSDESIVQVTYPERLLLGHQAGTALLTFMAPEDTLYKPAVFAVNVHVLSRAASQTFHVSQELPTYQGGDLRLSVEELEGVEYVWTTPKDAEYNGAGVNIPLKDSSDMGTYKVKIKEGNCFNDSLFTSVMALTNGILTIYELITPNGDGDNDVFYIANLDHTHANEVTVFNADHQVVYHEKDYYNTWSGGDLPDGTYRYFMTAADRQTYQGHLRIKR